jgi:hypothetical protein
MKLSSEEILTRVVKKYLRRVSDIESREDKAKEIVHAYRTENNDDTCELEEVVRKLGELQDGIKVGSWVHCPDGLGQVKELENNCATIHIHTFGRRTYSLGKLTLAGK